MKKWQGIIITLFSILTLVMLTAAGCSSEEPTTPDNNDNDNNPPDTEVVDTTSQPDSTGYGTIELVNTVETSDFPSYFAYNDEVLAYASNYRVYIMSLDNPESPAEVGEFPPDYPYTSMIKDIDIYDSILVIALDYPAKKLVFVNVSDPSSPTQISEISLPQTPQGICATQYYVFVGYGTLVNGDIVNYSIPDSPEIIKDLPCAFETADYYNYKLYCTSTNGNVHKVDVTDIENPTVQTANTGKQNLDIAVTPWGFLYIACGVQTGTNTGGFVIYDAEQMGIPEYSENIENYAAKNLDYQDNFVYLLLRPSLGGSDYVMKTYFVYHPDQAISFDEESVGLANCIAATNHYIYVGSRNLTGGGQIYVFHHQY